MSYFERVDALMIALFVGLILANLGAAFWARRRLAWHDASGSSGWLRLLVLVGLFVVTYLAWFVAVWPYALGYAGSHATFQHTLPSDPTYQEFLRREQLFDNTLGNPWLPFILFAFDFLLIGLPGLKSRVLD